MPCGTASYGPAPHPTANWSRTAATAGDPPAAAAPSAASTCAGRRASAPVHTAPLSPADPSAPRTRTPRHKGIQLLIDTYKTGCIHLSILPEATPKTVATHRPNKELLV